MLVSITEDNVKRDLRKQLAQDTAHWRVFVNSLAYLMFRGKKARNSSPVKHLSTSPEKAPTWYISD
jgi:hypothetical protein